MNAAKPASRIANLPRVQTLVTTMERHTTFDGSLAVRSAPPAATGWFLALWLALLWLPGLSAAETIPLRDDAQQVLRGVVGYCTLPPGSALPERPDQACAFQGQPLAELPTGFSAATHWVRFTASNPADFALDTWLEVGHSRLQRVVLHRKIGDTWQSVATGQAIPAQQRPLAAQRLLLPFSFQPGEAAEFVLQVASMTQIELNLRVWRTSDYFAHESKRQIVQALAMGGLLLAAAFSLMVYLRWRDPALLWLAASFVSQVGLDASFTGMLSAYFWPAETGYDVRLHGVLVASTAACLVQFVRNFLYTAQHYRIEDGVLRLALVALVLAAAGIFHWGYARPIQVLAVIALVSMATCIVVFYRAWRDGSGPAGYLLLSYVFLLLMIMQRASVAFGWIEAGIFQPVGYSWYFVLIAPTILLGVLKRTDALRDSLTREVADREAQNQLLTRMSHELRSPLNTVITQARLLQRAAGAGRSTQRVDERAAAIITGARRLLGMIDELLDHARVRAGRMSLHPVPVALSAYLHVVADDFRDPLANSGNTLELQLEDRLPEAVSVDAHRLRQVLDNLLSNASRYCRDGQVTLACAGRRLTPQRHALSFAVRDSGPGIDPYDQRQIFKPFQRGAVGQRSGVDGLGIGLSIAGDLVRLMGGQLQLESQPGEGSRFFFTIEADEVAPIEQPVDALFDAMAETLRFEWIESPLPPPEAPEAVGKRPDEPHLQALRALIAQGAVSDLQDWANTLIEASPEHSVFAQQLLDALARSNATVVRQWRLASISSSSCRSATESSISSRRTVRTGSGACDIAVMGRLANRLITVWRRRDSDRLPLPDTARHRHVAGGCRRSCLPV